MIGWPQILYGAALSGAAAAVLLTVVIHPRRPAPILVGAASAVVGPIAWNAILRATHADSFFTDAPVPVMPASWQDTGSGVWALALAALTLGLGLCRTAPASRVMTAALTAGLAAFLVDVYLY